MSDLSRVAGDVARLVDDVDELSDAAGMAARDTALDAAARDLGSDRTFSGMRNAAPLTATYVAGVLQLEPAGLWELAQRGRRQGGRSRAATGEALNTPWGPKSVTRFGPTRGHRTIDRAFDDMLEPVADAVGDVLDARIAAL